MNDECIQTSTWNNRFVKYIVYIIGIILWLRPANERWLYIATSSLTGWEHLQNDPWQLDPDVFTIVTTPTASWVHNDGTTQSALADQDCPDFNFYLQNGATIFRNGSWVSVKHGHMWCMSVLLNLPVYFSTVNNLFTYWCCDCNVLNPMLICVIIANLPHIAPILSSRNSCDYRKTSNIRRTMEGNAIVDHSDVVGVSPVGAAPTTSSFSSW